MKSLQSLVLIGLASATVLLAAAPASALTWTCTAQNLRGQKFSASAVGVISQAVYDRARIKAHAKCDTVSAVCSIVNCTKN